MTHPGEEQAAAAGEVSPGAKPVPEERVSQIFTTIIMGGAQNAAVGNSSVVQSAQQIQAGNMEALRRFLGDQASKRWSLARPASRLILDATSQSYRTLAKEAEAAAQTLGMRPHPIIGVRSPRD